MSSNKLLNCLCCRYYNLDAYYRRQMEKDLKKGFKKIVQKERTVFNDEEQRRYVSVHSALLVFIMKIKITWQL
jgi:hypothetical protein